MEPKSFEQPYNNLVPESNANLPEHMKLERGDVDYNDPALQNQTNPNQQTTTQSQQQIPSSQQPLPTQQTKVDPVEIVKGMISTGFTPTQAQIMKAGSNISGPVDSSNTWFAVFLQRIVKQKKLKSVKK